MNNITQTLINAGIIKQFKMPSYFYQSLFKHTHKSDKDVIIFDDVFEDYRGLAKFVAPNVVSSVNETKGAVIKAFKPAYVKEKDVIEAWNKVLQTRTAGEDIGGSYTPQQRAQQIRAKQMRMHRIKVENLIEYMCFQAMAQGQVLIKGEKYPTTTVSYGRDASLTLSTLSGGAWSATVNPLTAIGQMSDLAYEKGEANIDTLIMGRNAWAQMYAYFSHKDRAHLLNMDTRGSDLTMNLLAAGQVKGVARVASFTSNNGQTMEVYVDNRSYIDAAGKAHRFVSDNEVIGIDSVGFIGAQAFGAILDADAGFIATRMFHKEFRTDEPSADYLLTQSAPLPIAITPNSTFRILDVTQ